MKSFFEGLRILLVLGRVSNLPTVWSNIFAGWFLGGGRNDPVVLSLLLIGSSLLYVGGMFLNDFFDADFDARYCATRPIPAGKISRHTVGIFATLWFVVGFACVAVLGGFTAGIALLLIAAIVLYDYRHKNISWAPLVMGICRFLLYLLAASTISLRISWLIVLWGLALGLYVAGITYLARGESRPGKSTRWPLSLLLLPFAISFENCFLGNAELLPTLLSCLLLLGWMAWLLVPLWRKTNRSIGRVVSGLLASIVLVDFIATSSILGYEAVWFLGFFILALLLQCVVPAT
jgi:4-hydroxybenzoate polyprenyltransferase